MTEETNPAEAFDFEGLSEEQQAVLKQVFTVHEIERAMLSRAITVICKITGRTPEGTVKQLAEGLDDAYASAVQEETKPAKPALYIPKLIH